MFSLSRFFIVIMLLLGVNLLPIALQAEEIELTKSSNEEPITKTESETTNSKQQDTTENTELTADPYDALKAAINNYMSLWQKQDIKAIYQLESWEGGQEVDEITYIKDFKSDTKIYEWDVTLIQKDGEDGIYKVLVPIKHSPPKHVQAFVAKNLKLRSTLSQWWKKDGDKYVHLYNIEKQRLGFFPEKLPKPKFPVLEELKESHEQDHAH